MRKPNSKYISSLFVAMLCLVHFAALASHNIAGEITYRPVGNPGDNKYEITITTYTDSDQGAAAHRDRLDLHFGDGTSETVLVTTQKIPVGPPGSNMWKNTYVTTHVFPGDGCYDIWFDDPNRVAGILNFTTTKSENVFFYVQTRLCINSNLGIPAINHSPYLTADPVSFGCVGRAYSFNPSAYDVDGDSLYYELVAPEDEGKPIDGYVDPDDPKTNGGAANGVFEIDPLSGQISWITPRRQGWYNIAIRVYEFRQVITENAVIRRQIGYITRDMQIRIEVCDNDPPVITEVKDTCIVAGDASVLSIKMTATDPDNCFGNSVTFSATGGPFQVPNSPAELKGTLVDKKTVTANFSWRIDCSHIRKQPYQVVMNASDNDCGRNNPKSLSDVKFFNIRIIGPEPENPRAEAKGNGILLNWDKTKCDNAVAYYIYRKESPSNWTPDTCENGILPGLGYKNIKTITDLSSLTYYDDNNGTGLFHGVNYCYRITALFKEEGQFEQVEGRASDEVCAFLKKDVPVITNVTVDSTASRTGIITIAWASPIDLDTNEYPGPYEYKIKQSPDLSGNEMTEVQVISAKFFNDLVKDTTYTFIGLNTLSLAYSYEIEFDYTNYLNDPAGELDSVGAAKSASMPRLELNPGYEFMKLDVKTDVPWKNEEYTIFRHNKKTNTWDSIGTSDTATFIDSNLTIGVTYCYYVRTNGSFGVDGFVDPTINFSQQACDKPVDTIAPCPPILLANAHCDAFNTDLNWSFENEICAADLIKYRIHFQNQGIGDFEQVAEFEGDQFDKAFNDARTTLNYSLAGCYYVTAVDSYDNVSAHSNIVCVDNCPEYILPNIITPNGDSLNDLFRPFPYRFVESVDFQVFNRWGQVVYQTSNPNLGWDGTDLNNGKPLSPGVYYYVIDINQIRLRENQVVSKTGTIHILR